MIEMILGAILTVFVIFVLSFLIVSIVGWFVWWMYYEPAYKDWERRTDAYIRRLDTEIKIEKSIIRTIDEIQSLNEDGILTDREFIEISERIGWC